MNALKRGVHVSQQTPSDRGALAMFELALEALDPRSPGRSAQVAELRRRMDLACDAGQITIKEWRTLLDKVAAFQLHPPNSSYWE